MTLSNFNKTELSVVSFQTFVNFKIFSYEIQNSKKLNICNKLEQKYIQYISKFLVDNLFSAEHKRLIAQSQKHVRIHLKKHINPEIRIHISNQYELDSEL